MLFGIEVQQHILTLFTPHLIFQSSTMTANWICAHKCLRMLHKPLHDVRADGSWIMDPPLPRKGFKLGKRNLMNETRTYSLSDPVRSGWLTGM